MIKCPICSKEMKSLTKSHLNTHNMTLEKFIELYPSFLRQSTETLLKRSKASIITNTNRWKTEERKEQYVPKECKECGKKISWEFKRNTFCSVSCSTTYNNKKIWEKATSDHPWRNKRPIFSSKGEKKLYQYLIETYPDLEWKKQKRIFIEERELRIDIFSEKLNIFIEYDGRIHFHNIYGEKRLASIKERDLSLKNYCETNKIKLIRINESTFIKSDKWKEKIDILLNTKSHFIEFLYTIEEL